MTPYYQDDHVTLYHGDCIEVMKSLPPQSIDAVITSPPYAEQRKSTYGGVNESDFPHWTVEWMRTVKPLLRERAGVAINITPHLRDGMVSDYVMRTRLALRADGWYEHDELVWVKPDGMPAGRPHWPVRAWESILWYSLSSDPYCDAKQNGNELNERDRARGASPASFQGRATRLGWDHLPKGSGRMGERSRGKNWLSLAVRTVGNDIDHPAPFPPRLSDWLVRFFAPEGGTVLDPFSGSGTTGLSSARHGNKYIGIDLNTEYLDLSLRTRLQQPGLDLAGTSA